MLVQVVRRRDGLPSLMEPKESLLAQATTSQNGEKVRFAPLSSKALFSSIDLSSRTSMQEADHPRGEVHMSGQVVLYFDDQADALRFALAAGQVMAGESSKFTNDLLQETARVTRIRLDAVNAGHVKKPSPGRVA